MLSLTASDGELSSSDVLSVVVNRRDGTRIMAETFGTAASSDDAEERLRDGRVALKSGDLELTNDNGVDQVVGVRFRSVNVPKGAIIKKAYVEFTTDEPTDGSALLFVEGEATDHARTFRSRARNISSRLRTQSSVTWNPEAWPSVGERAERQKTPDLSPIVQEIVDREGWEPGNAVAVIITGAGNRTAVSWDGDAKRAPSLYVEYEVEDDSTQTLGEDEPFMAYNDLSWTLGQLSENITLYTTESGDSELPEGHQGELVDYATGLLTPVVLEVVGGNWIRTAPRGRRSRS